MMCEDIWMWYEFSRWWRNCDGKLNQNILVVADAMTSSIGQIFCGHTSDFIPAVLSALSSSKLNHECNWKCWFSETDFGLNFPLICALWLVAWVSMFSPHPAVPGGWLSTAEPLLSAPVWFQPVPYEFKSYTLQPRKAQQQHLVIEAPQPCAAWWTSKVMHNTNPLREGVKKKNSWSQVVEIHSKECFFDSQYHCCWCLGDTSHQSISSHEIDLVFC